jgi:hypothetical protein
MDLVNEVGSWIEQYDPEGKLSEDDMRTILVGVMEASAFVRREQSDRPCGPKVGEAADDKEVEKEAKDREVKKFMKRLVQKTIKEILQRPTEKEPSPEPRFQKLEHVVLNIGSEWTSAVIQGGNAAEEKLKLPYSIKIDPPVDQIISCPVDTNDAVRLEVCFGQDGDGPMFTLWCLPQVNEGTAERRFCVGERVACAVQAPDSTGTVWAAGTVTEMEISMQEAAERHLPQGAAAGKWPMGVPTVPYLVQLDCGRSVLVQKDQHWLIRDLELQGEGSRLERMEKRQRAGAWAMVDHMTRQVRPLQNDMGALQKAREENERLKAELAQMKQA